MKPADVLAELAVFELRRSEDEPELARFRSLLGETDAPFSRRQYAPGHLTCSACVLDSVGPRVLLLHHAKLDRWLQPGGHVEPDDDSPLDAARREVAEESGLEELSVLSGLAGNLVDVDIHEIPAHGDEPAHLHYDLRYAFAAPGAPPLVASDESHALRWIDVSELEAITDEVSVTRLVARALERLQR